MMLPFCTPLEEYLEHPYQPHPKRKKKNNMNHKNQGTRVNDTNNLIRLEKHWRHY